MSDQTARETKGRASVSAADRAADRTRPEEERSVREEVVEGYHELEQRYEEARQSVYAVNRSAVDFIEENPVLSIATAFGVGYVFGKLAARRWIG